MSNQTFTGLTQAEVDNLIQNGKTNQVKNKISKSYFRIIFDNVCTFFNLLCLICFVVLLMIDTPISNYGFILVYIANIIIGIVQEVRAKLTVEKLSLVKVPTVKVIRDNKEQIIPTKNIVLGDIVILGLGDQIPADMTILDGFAEVDESLLTGEAIPIKKGINDKLLSGSFIVSGNCIARAEKVGNDCYVQTLTEKAKKFKKTKSELLNTMKTIINFVSILIIPIAILSGLVNSSVFSKTLSGTPLVTEVVQRTTAVIIGMIPGGMFLLTTLSLAVGIIKLAKYNTLVQDMYSLEMLARVNTLCLDKTGTITDGNMTLQDIVILDKNYDVNTILPNMMLSLNDNNQTAVAILKNYPNYTLNKKPTLVLPFSSKRKNSAVTFDKETFVLGAPDFVTKVDSKVQAQIDTEIRIGNRVLLLGVTSGKIEDDKIIGDITPIALIVLQDNIRKEAIETIKWFNDNGVDIKVISGDAPETVAEISRRAGVKNSQNYVNLYGKSDKEVILCATKYTVFGRVTPEQKALIIKTIKGSGKTVGMTGDGVNDILAMKEADCAITVATGATATRSLAHIVLMDNNFNSLPKVVSEGRRVINNVERSSSLYLMKTMFTIILAIISIILRQVYPYTTGQMLMLEMLIIGLSSLLLSIQPNDNLVKGKFISELFYRAFPGTVILVFNAVLSQIIGDNLGLTVEVSATFSALALTFGGFAFLIMLCLPFDKFRLGLVIFITALIAFCTTVLVDTPIFNLTRLTFENNMAEILFLFAFTVVDIPIHILVSKLCRIVTNHLEKSSQKV